MQRFQHIFSYQQLISLSLSHSIDYFCLAARCEFFVRSRYETCSISMKIFSWKLTMTQVTNIRLSIIFQSDIRSNILSCFSFLLQSFLFTVFANAFNFSAWKVSLISNNFDTNGIPCISMRVSTLTSKVII